MTTEGYRVVGTNVTVREDDDGDRWFRLDDDDASKFSKDLDRLGMALVVAEARFEARNID